MPVARSPDPIVARLRRHAGDHLSISAGRGGTVAPRWETGGVSLPEQSPHRSGFVALVGRPNAGKTTLTNALVGEKVGIVSNRPQTTRHAIRGVVHKPAGQIVLVDTPGLHKPKSLLGKRLNDVVRDTLSDVDVIVFCIPADQPVGTGDAFIARQLREVKAPIVLVVTKTDAASKKQVAEQLMAASALVDAAEVVPVSAVAGDQVELLEDLLIGLLPEGPPLYPEEQTTDDDTERQIAELIREAALEKVRQEVPHSLAVTIEEMVRRPDPKRADGELIEVHALLHVERNSQKPMLLGKGGQIIKAIGSEARAGMETLLGARVHLELHVTVFGEWQDDPKKLNRLGY
jgi:GTP-binding protein Era